MNIDNDNIWSRRLSLASKYYNSWESIFRCKDLEKYYEGFQWKNIPDNYYPRTLNEFYSIIKIKEAIYLFSHPKYLISPKPAYAEYDIESAVRTVQIKEDLVNTVVQDENNKYTDEVELAFLDSIFRYGIIEVGYSANWIRNPRAGKPLLKSHRNQDINFDRDKIVREPDELPINETFYFKRIHAKRFRVGGIDATYLEQCSWVGYYEFVHKRDLCSLKEIKNRDLLIKDGIASRSDDYDDFVDEPNELLKGGDVVKVWHIWDNRAKERLLLLDVPTLELWKAPFIRLPLFDIKWDYRTHGWYPIPPAFQWLSPQDELNESREMLRAHRKRFVRKYQYLEDAVDPQELEKFQHGPDGTVVAVKRDQAIQPIQNADLGVAIDKSLLIASDDLNKVSGTSSEQRGEADRTTATQAKLIAYRASEREDYELARITKWMCRMGREVILLAKEKLAVGTWIQLSGQNEQLLGEVQELAPAYQWITSEDIDNYDFRIQVDVTTMSPIKAEDEKKRFVEFISLVTNFPQIAFSPTLIREAAYRCGYRNERVIKEMQQMALITMFGQLNQGQQQGQQIAQQNTAQMEPPTQTETDNQLSRQLLVQ